VKTAGARAAPRLSRAREAWIFAAGALAVRAAIVAWAARRFPAVEDGFYYDTLARRLAHGDGYTWLWPDGAVTYAAHYPVGYPALVAPLYAVFGASPVVAMAFNAIVGALGVFAALRLLEGTGRGAWRVAGVVLALHPALAAYTPAVMTEGVTASIVALAAFFASRARDASALEDARRGHAWRFAAGVAIGIATLVRPQSIALAPALGALAFGVASWRARALGAALVTAIALVCCAPWTARNCARMDRCALVSVNGGWNLLIGVRSTSGGWAAVDPVPDECREVWSEAMKDVCFERAARAAIARDPVAWAAKAPAKLAATLDYFGAAPWYLHASNAVAQRSRSARSRRSSCARSSCSRFFASRSSTVRAFGRDARSRRPERSPPFPCTLGPRTSRSRSRSLSSDVASRRFRRSSRLPRSSSRRPRSRTPRSSAPGATA